MATEKVSTQTEKATQFRQHSHLPQVHRNRARLNVEHQCWINTLTDFYNDKLMGEKRKPQLTRKAVLVFEGTAKDEFKNKGASKEHMSKVFNNITRLLG